MILDHAMAHACLLVYANKSDLPHALSAEEVRDELKLEQLREHAWHVQPSCGTSGEGLWLGLKWLAKGWQPNHTPPYARRGRAGWCRAPPAPGVRPERVRSLVKG